MIKNIALLFYTFLILITFGCNRITQEKIPDGWIKIKLPVHWIIYVPPGFIYKKEMGIDSQPGVIYCQKDSITLRFDSGVELLKKKNCTFQNTYIETKADVDTGFYKKYYNIPIMHTVYIDTIDSRIAVIVKPTGNKKGTLALEIRPDCSTMRWIGIATNELPETKQKLVLTIFSTIKQEN